jgi:hypothetical protein
MDVSGAEQASRESEIMAKHKIQQHMLDEISWLRDQGKVEMADALEKQMSEHGELPDIKVWSHRTRCGYEVGDE